MFCVFLIFLLDRLTFTSHSLKTSIFHIDCVINDIDIYLKIVHHLLWSTPRPNTVSSFTGIFDYDLFVIFFA